MLRAGAVEGCGFIWIIASLSFGFFFVISHGSHFRLFDGINMARNLERNPFGPYELLSERQAHLLCIRCYRLERSQWGAVNPLTSEAAVDPQVCFQRKKQVHARKYCQLSLNCLPPHLVFNALKLSLYTQPGNSSAPEWLHWCQNFEQNDGHCSPSVPQTFLPLVWSEWKHQVSDGWRVPKKRII